MPARDAVMAVARGWFRSARSDLAVARLALVERGDIDPWVVAFHAQQTAEKLFKAVLVIEQIPFGRTHELERLYLLVPPDWLVTEPDKLAALSRFATSGRYPPDSSLSGSEPSWADAEASVRTAGALAATILEGARSRGLPV